MSERKVLNKYYPPDFDPSKLPRVKRDKNRQFTIRLMAPFNMRCITCGEYIYRGKKFNARKEDVIGKTYLGIQVYRFYIKCTKCLAEITFLTDPENQDYAMENGAIRNFESIRLAEKQADADAKQKKEEEVNNPMKILENRTRDSRREMAVLETLEDLREMNAAHAGIDPKIILEAEEEYKRQLERLQMQEDEEELQRIMSSRKRPIGSNGDDEEEEDPDDNGETQPKSTQIRLKEKDENEWKKLKVSEPTVKIEPNTSVLFKKPTTSVESTSRFKSEVGQLSKNNISSFIKKKPVVVKQEATEAVTAAVPPKPDIQPTSLLSLINAYDDSSSSDQDN